MSHILNLNAIFGACLLWVVVQTTKDSWFLQGQHPHARNLPPCSSLRATSHTRLRAATITLQAHLLVEKVEPVQVRFTLCLRDQRSMWMQDKCKVYMDSYMASNGSCFMITLTILNKKPPLGGRPNTKPGDHGTPNAHNCWFILIYHVWPAWIEIHWNSIWLRAQSHMTSQYTWGFVTTLNDFGGVLGHPVDTFFWGSHNFMVTALGFCVEWPLVTFHRDQQGPTHLEASSSFIPNRNLTWLVPIPPDRRWPLRSLTTIKG